jgi:hypothetical protein
MRITDNQISKNKKFSSKNLKNLKDSGLKSTAFMKKFSIESLSFWSGQNPDVTYVIYIS